MEVKSKKVLGCNSCDSLTFNVQLIQLEKGHHEKLVCAECGAYLKFAKQNNLDFVMPFGKNKGKTLSQIAKEDPNYFAWAVENMKPPMGDKFRSFEL